MITADDHWPATLQRVIATLEFKVEDPQAIVPVMEIESRQDIHSLPAAEPWASMPNVGAW